MPGGAPLILGPVLVLIETASYLTRIISFRSSFGSKYLCWAFAFEYYLWVCYKFIKYGLIFSWIGAGLIVIFIFLLEMAVAAIQAYVFCLLNFYLSGRHL